MLLFAIAAVVIPSSGELFQPARRGGRGPGAHLFGQGGDMLRGRGLDDAVSQVEHERAPAQCAQDAVCFGVERGAAGDQKLGIEVALHAPAQAALQPLRGPSERHRRVQADAVRAGGLGEAVVGEPGPPGGRR